MGRTFKYRFWIFLLMFCPKLSSVILAQNYTLSNWTVEDGLSSNDTKDLLQDKDGFIWIATEHGLNKFDGYTFQKHRYHPNDSTSIGANFINNICEDDEGNIWVNLGVGIISKYEKLSRKFINYSFPQRKTFASDIKFISEIGICIATNRGLFTLDQESQELILLTAKEGAQSRLVQSIYSFSNQKIYLGTNNGLEIFDPSSKTITSSFIITSSDTSYFDLPIGLFFQDSQRIIWIQSYGTLLKSRDGIYFEKVISSDIKLLDASSTSMFIFKDAKAKHWFFAKSKNKNHSDTTSIFPLPNEEISTAFKDKNESVWVISKKNKLLKWNGTCWETIIDFSGQIESWEIQDFFVDEKNGIWLSTRGKGIWRVYNRKWPINSLKNNQTKGLIDFDISALSIDNEEYMWVGSFGNLYRYYFKSEELVPVFSDLKKENPLFNFRVNDIIKTKDGKIGPSSK